MQKFLTCLITAALAAATAALPLPAQAQTTGYNLPPKEILDVMRAPSPPQPLVSPARDRILLVAMQEYPSIARVSTPYLRLAGVRVEPKNHSKHDTPGGYGITACAESYSLVRIADGSTVPITLPAGSCAGVPKWSADGKRFAFVNLAENSVELWLGDPGTGAIHKVPGVRLNPMFGDDLQWMPDQKALLVKLVPDGMGAPPAEPVVPAGPSIQETDGRSGQSSTYENRDTLNNQHDEDLFDYYAASQLALVDEATGSISPLGKPGNFSDVSPSPDGKHLLVQEIHKPYSYITTYDRFPHDVEVWDLTGNDVHRQTLAQLPLADRVPIRGVPVGPRDFEWRANQPATLLWAEALDNGDWKVKVPHRDKIMMQAAPFDKPGVQVDLTEQRMEGMAWGEQPGVALIIEYDDNRHWLQAHIVNMDTPDAKPVLLWDFSSDEHYANPGNPVMHELANGANVMEQTGDSIFASGVGSSPDGDRPFLDRVDLKTHATERLFRSDKTDYDRFLAFTGPAHKTFLTWRQSPMDPPNAFAHTLGKPVKAAADEAVVTSTSAAVTHIPDPSPQVRAIKKRLVHYKRADGLDLSFTLYTPPGYQEGTRVPTILYAYPLDYADPAKAGQVTGSQETFTRLYEYRLLLLGGYAIIDNASFPIVGDPRKAYDTYLEQLVADAKAAVDKAVEIGVADPNRIGVTGHSHGALMTANLVAHSDLFRAGVATSGSYNKTLTPFGFQNEQRSVWEAPDVYQKVSPFFFADKLKTPLLIIHGAEDANPGTTPLQASKLYEAIRGNGGTTRLVLLPHEPHWYSAMESNEQLIYEMLRWFDKYVKNAPAK
jgi:dipeptidyl aminopeptidase/acylaminoacyl peptidase